MSWQEPNRTPAQRRSIELANHVRRIRLRHRVDVVLLGWVFMLLIGVVGLWAAAVEISDRLGVFDAPLVRPIPDERILTNVRNNLASQRLLDAVFHAPDNRIYLAQEGGVIHRYDPETGLWSEETPFAQGNPIRTDLVQLRSGCGVDPLASQAQTCPDPNSLWAISQGGGLARRINGKWEVVVGDTQFIGASDDPVEHDQLTSTAISSDNRWLVVGTKDDGIGIYDIDHHTWLTLGSALFEGLPSQTITHVQWWRDRFWIGGPEGVISLTMRRGSPQLIQVPDMVGAVLDMEAGADTALWILEQRNCKESGSNCLRLSKLAQPNQSPIVLLDEANHFAEVNLVDLHFAQQVGDVLTLVGDAGIFSYDTSLHRWERLFDKPVGTVLSFQDGQGFYFAVPFGVGLTASTGITTTWSLPDQQVTKLQYGRTDEVLAMTDQGNVYGLKPAGEVVPVFVPTSTTIDPISFTHAVAMTDTVLFLGKDGGLLHNMRTRTYEDIAQDLLVEWLVGPNTRLINTGEEVYGLSEDMADSQTKIYRVPSRDLASLDFYKSRDLINVLPTEMPGPINRAWVIDDASLGLIAGDGSIYRLRSGMTEQLTGQAEFEMDSVELLDVVDVGEDLVIAANKGVRRYNANQRAWEDFVELTVDNYATDVDGYQDEVLAVTDNNRLVLLGASTSVMIGDSIGFGVDNAGVSDALLVGGQLYLAGQGKVEKYDTEHRQITERWSLPGDAQVTLKGIIDDLPLALTEDIATLGDSVLDPEAGTVVNLFADADNIWSVRDEGGRRYLKGYPVSSPLDSSTARCFFRNSATGVNRILDARPLPAPLPTGTIAVATDTGLWFYAPSARSWFRAPADLIPRGGRAYVLSGHLLLIEELPEGRKVSIIPLDSIALPGSCSIEAAIVDAQIFDVQAVAVDERSGRAVWVLPDGAVVEWQAGKETAVLPPVSVGPQRADLRRVYDRSNADHLLFTTDSGILRYDLVQRQWTPITLQFSDTTEQIADINIESRNNAETVTVQMTDGRFFVGTFSVAVDTVSLSLVYTPPELTFDSSAAALLDVQDRGDSLWTFVLSDGIKYLDPKTRQWLTSAVFTDSDPSLAYYRVIDRGVAVTDGGRAWWIAQTTEPAPTRFTRYELRLEETTALDEAGIVWRLRPDGVLLKCLAGQDSTYACQQGAPSPFLVEVGRVRHVYSWQNLLIFEEDGGLRAFDPASHQLEELPQEAASFSQIDHARAYQDQLWLQSPRGLLVLEKDKNEKVLALAFPDVKDVVHDANGRPWAWVSEGWRVWTETGFSNPRIASSSVFSGTGVGPFVTESAVATAIDDQGFPYWWADEEQRNDIPLPITLNRNAITALYRGSDKDWWVASENRVDHIVSTQCPQETGQPEASPSVVAVSPQTSSTVLATAPTPLLENMLCLRISATASLPPEFGAVTAENLAQAVVRSDGGLELTNRRGTRVTLTEGVSGTVLITPQGNVTLALQGQMDDQWPVLRRNVAQLPTGATAYDPFTKLSTDSSGALIAERPSQRIQLAAKAALQSELPNFLPPSLNAGWLAWNRDQAAFQVMTPTGVQSIPKQDFIDDKTLLFEEVEAILAEEPTRLHIANQHGIWTYAQTELGLDDRSIVYQPIDLGSSVRAAHGRFLTQMGDVPIGGWQVQQPMRELRFAVDDVTFVEQIRVSSVDVQATVGGRPTPAFAADGFIWDVNRRGVSYENQDILLQSAVGVQPVDRLADFDPGPNLLATREGELRFESGYGPLLWDGYGWRERSRTGWQAVKNPTTDRNLVDNSVWAWKLQNNQVEITLSGATYDFQHGVMTGEYMFNSDQLKDASGYQGRLYVATDAFFEVATGPAALEMFTARRLAPVETDRLETLPFGDGSTAFYSRLNSTPRRWDESKSSFVPVSVADDPYRQRILVESPRLRFTKYPDKVVKELRVDLITGDNEWVVFGFTDGQFPFDAINSLVISDDVLYLGSAAGLQVYADPLSTGLDSAQAIIDMRGTGDTALLPVSRLGVPKNEPSSVIAESTRMCIQSMNPKNFVVCGESGLLDTELLARTTLWEWSSDQIGQVEGNYLDQTGKSTTLNARITNGRFPHDQLIDVVACDGRTFTLWQSGWITVHFNDLIRLLPTIQNYPMQEASLERLLCVEREVPLTGTAIQPGAYALGGDGEVWQWLGTRWMQVASSTIARGVQDRADRPPILDGKDLRLLPRIDNQSVDQPTLAFEQRQLDSTWSTLPWLLGQVGLDQWRELLYQEQGDRLWAATPVGLVTFNRDAAGQAALDRDHLVIVQEPAYDTEPCQITDLTENEGAVLARCNADSTRVFTGQLDESIDSGVFQPLAGQDPFAEHEVVAQESTGYWRWRVIGRTGGSLGSLDVQIRDEDVQLNGGRFSFDTINSLALFKDGLVELGTDESGWLEIGLDRVSVADLRWPTSSELDSSTISRVGITRVDDQAMLCLRHANGDGYIRLAAGSTPEQTERCPEYQGDDGLWRYFQDEDGVLILAPDSLGGTGIRVLKAGRFQDDLISGVPAVEGNQQTYGYWLPTESGVLHLNRFLTRDGLHVGPFSGLSENVVPSSIYMHTSDMPLYITPQGFRHLDGTRDLASDVPLDVPADATLVSVEDTLNNLTVVRWRSPQGFGWSLVNYETLQSMGKNVMPIDLSQLEDFVEQRIAWGDPDPWLTTQFSDDAIHFLGLGSAQGISLAVPDLNLVRPFIASNRLLLIGEQQLLEVNLKQAMIETYLSGQVAPSSTMEVATATASSTRIDSSPTITSATPASPTLTILSAATVTPTVAPYGEVISEKLNLRTGPGVAYAVTGTVVRGTELVLIGRNDAQSWWEVRLADGREGWVSGQFIERHGCLDCIVVTTPVPKTTLLPTETPTILLTPTATSSPTKIALPTYTPIPIKTPTVPPTITPTLSATSTSMPISTPQLVVASNRTDFSGNQGDRGWKYLVESSRNSGAWEPMRFDGICYRSNNWEQDVRICAEGEVHPGQSTRIAYEWRPSSSGFVVITVHAHKIDTRCGDGIWIGTYRARDGQGIEKEFGNYQIGGGDNRGQTREYESAVDPGNLFYFVIDILGESTCDLTRVQIDIR